MTFAERAQELSTIASWATGCLVESAEGRLVAHRLPSSSSLPGEVVEAVLSGELRLLDRSLTRRRTLGLVSSGPVLAAHVARGGTSIVRVPLREAGRALGALWLLGPPPDLVELEGAAARATQLLLGVRSDQPALLWCLEGHPDAVLPASLAECSKIWVAAVVGKCRELTTTDGLAVERCAVGPISYVAMGGTSRATNDGVLQLVRSAVRAGTGARAGLSLVGGPEQIGRARQQADLALQVAGTGECVGLEQARSALVVRHAVASLASLPDLGPDPLDALRDHDARKGAQLTHTLGCWLDTARDHAATASALQIHANTLRYRLQRIEQLLQLDLRRNTAVVLELHLRLSAAAQHPQLSRRTSSTGS